MNERRCRIVHLSDIHVGCLAHPGITDALLRDVNAIGADLLVITGDLVQRAHRYQYRRATALLKAFQAPYVVVPGNHDLYSWIYRPWLRMTVPRGRYKRYITNDLSPTWSAPGISVLGLDTATPWTIQRGRCTEEHAGRVREHFDGITSDTLKVLALHHPIVDLNWEWQRDIAQGAEGLAAAAAQAGVDLILSGHWHCSLLREVVAEGQPMMISLAGTACGGRFRPPAEGVNAFTVVDVFDDQLEFAKWRFDPQRAAYQTATSQALSRSKQA